MALMKRANAVATEVKEEVKAVPAAAEAKKDEKPAAEVKTEAPVKKEAEKKEAEKKTAVKKTAAKTKKTAGRKKAATKTAAADKAVSADDAAKKTEKKAAKKTTTRKTAAKKTTAKTAAKKTTTRKTAAKKEPSAKKTAAKVSEALVVQFRGREVSAAQIKERFKDVWTKDYLRKMSEVKDVTFYIKPEDSAVYFAVNNGEDTGSFAI